MLLPPLLQSALIVVSLLHVSASPTPLPDKWDAQPNSAANCSWMQNSPSADGRNEPMRFAVDMRGFGSREGAPGQGLLDNMRSATRGSMHVEDWKADAIGETGSRATFTIVPALWVVNSVQGAIWDASGKQVGVACERTYNAA
ncbi:MAG: hypothetical protein M1832_004975 [Thelocarpon impressellum]|nr:MAG: hypothetical protein M1832_004975 [Thelocarpon impressellum]